MSCLAIGGSSRLATVGCCSAELIQVVKRFTIKSAFRRSHCASIHPPPPGLVWAYPKRGRRSILEKVVVARRASIADVLGIRVAIRSGLPVPSTLLLFYKEHASEVKLHRLPFGRGLLIVGLKVFVSPSRQRISRPSRRIAASKGSYLPCQVGTSDIQSAMHSRFDAHNPVIIKRSRLRLINTGAGVTLAAFNIRCQGCPRHL
jgi:hypothetical protein